MYVVSANKSALVLLAIIMLLAGLSLGLVLGLQPTIPLG